MSISSKLRPVGLAVLTLLGAVHLSTAEAAEPAMFNCEDRAIGYGQGYCDAKHGDNWSSGDITYTCNADGSITVHEVNCY